MGTLKRFFLYVTNNETVSRHEEEFDIAFFIINTLAVLLGGAYLWYISQWEWIPFLIIEYTWAIDTMRHNRPKQHDDLTK
jgi:hypothetical protein